SVDEAAVRRLPGVVAVVRDASFLAVAALREEQAIRARDALKQSAKWEETAALPPSGDALYRQLMSSPLPAQTVAEKTTATAAAPVKTLDALYTRPYQCHGSLGPSCAVAQWQERTLTVWTHSQGVFPLRADLAKAFGIEPGHIRCIHLEGAGCYGHNGADDVALDAALLARATDGRPVKLQWMRDDEFMWEPYGSAMAMRLSGGLDAEGNVVAWTHELWSHPHSTRPGSSAGVNLLAARHLARPFPPVRLRHLKDSRARAVVEAAAQRAGWRPHAKGDGVRGRGIAFAKYKNLAAYCAMAADVEVERQSGRVSVTRVVAAVDAGQIVNPDGVINQIEGGIIQSTSWTLKEAVRFDRTRVTTRSWADYPIVRFTEAPEVEVVLLDRPDERFLGVGEGAQGPTAAAIANALANATGTRVRALPFTPERVRQAMAALTPP